VPARWPTARMRSWQFGYVPEIREKGRGNMRYEFNADDVFEIAEQLERNGAEFYRAAADRVGDKGHKAFLSGLSRMELEHEKVFSSMREELKGKEKEPTVFDPEGESERYLRALADTRVFFEKQMDATTMEGILKAAILAEKDSIVFYLGMKDWVPGDRGAAKMDKIIREEMHHVRSLSAELIKLMGLGGC
jgi:rubrerythrin